jgi:hypothetical protein
MRRLLLIPLLVAACKDNNNNGMCSNNNNDNYRSGALCSSAGTCPPNQTCTVEGICRRSCTTPQLSGMNGGQTCECNGPQPPGTSSGDQCDLDLYCRPSCSGGPPGGNSCMPGVGCPSGLVCDTMINICRQQCNGSPDGGSNCPEGFECIVDSQSTCHICRPKGGPGTVGSTCSSGTGCNSGLICDPFSHTCLFACGMGGSSCGPFGNCPNGSGCDPMMGNVCRPLCQGGQCSNGGMCVTPQGSSCAICRPGTTGNGPTILATTPGASHIALDGATLVWSTNNDIRRCGTSGCMNQPGQVAVTSAQAAGAIGVAAGGGMTFWNNGGSSMAGCSTNGNCGNPAPLGTLNQPGGGGIALGGGLLVWGTGVGAGICPVSGCSGSPMTIYTTTSGPGPEWIAYDAANGDFYFGADGKILVQGPSTSATAATVTTNAGTVKAIVADGNEVFWTNTLSVRRCTVSGCANNPGYVTDNRMSLGGLAVDASNVYWTEPNNGQIFKCPRSPGCNVSFAPFITNQNQPYDIVVDGTSIYWTNKGDGTVMKAPK